MSPSEGIRGWVPVVLIVCAGWVCGDWAFWSVKWLASPVFFGDIIIDASRGMGLLFAAFIAWRLRARNGSDRDVSEGTAIAEAVVCGALVGCAMGYGGIRAIAWIDDSNLGPLIAMLVGGRLGSLWEV